MHRRIQKIVQYIPSVALPILLGKKAHAEGQPQPGSQNPFLNGHANIRPEIKVTIPEGKAPAQNRPEFVALLTADLKDIDFNTLGDNEEKTAEVPPPENKSRYITSTQYQPAKASYGFFTREGGVSEDVRFDEGTKSFTCAFSSLNVGVATKDKPEHIIENIKIAFDKVRLDRGRPLDDSSWLFINETTYSNRVLTITDENIEELKAKYARKADDPFAALNNFCTRIPSDGFVTTSKDVVLSAVGADAHTVVLIDEESGVAGVFAGSWKGLAKGLYEKVVEEMVRNGAKRESIVTIPGPGLSKENYEFNSQYNAGSNDHSGVFFGKGKGVDGVTGIAVDAKDIDPATGRPVPYISNPEYEQFFPLRQEIDKETGLPSQTPQKCDFDILGLLAYKAKEQGLTRGIITDCAVNNRTDDRFFSARYAVEKAGFQPDGKMHQLITGRNFNFVTLISNQKNNNPALIP